MQETGRMFIGVASLGRRGGVLVLFMVRRGPWRPGLDRRGKYCWETGL